ncbi:MAG: hypothetical protein HY074_14765 [Deltaproteobacteria bacterium]|nr:hypothetical protein [Deltaproteobacteria bacterium]
MLFELLGRLIERVQYESQRVRKVAPTMIRLSISELGELYHRFNHWRGACDHVVTPGPRIRKRARRQKVKTARGYSKRK